MNDYNSLFINKNQMNRLTSTVNPLGQTKKYFYDSVGNLTHYKNARGQTIVYEYDALNRLVNLFVQVLNCALLINIRMSNLYTYVGNSPLNWIDPLGLWYIDINFTAGFLTGGTLG